MSGSIQPSQYAETMARLTSEVETARKRLEEAKQKFAAANQALEMFLASVRSSVPGVWAPELTDKDIVAIVQATEAVVSSVNQLQELHDRK